ncbi:trans-aconitate 2-methyltransferase [Promicromonospora umidemergens]|uniref:Methyltransferase domain-containing protein n=1 Tax=Promicromonospora umidemergens TaxID=629679 RepID=A0ABP8XWN9_9MICO|nr:methyltransferase domain-containing protein [Promicromonospora umidemergens]MCP2284299.1 trans-aconitate 2-methyltransferase [Promicromonospora umidemergens]
MADWNPGAYLQYTDERSRPFTELVARVPGTPSTVVDLGCGPGHLTAVLRARWPEAHVTGVDASPAMIEKARAADPDTEYVLADLSTDEHTADLVISNAALQWVPGHRELLPALADRATQTFAFQVPGNQDAPSHTLLRKVAARAPYADVVGPVERRAAADPAEYLDLLARPGWTVDVWETTYTHLLHGPDPVLRWISATGAQPTLQALEAEDPGLRARFEQEFGAALRAAYPQRAHGTPLAFRRVFAVATRA